MSNGFSAVDTALDSDVLIKLYFLIIKQTYNSNMFFIGYLINYNWFARQKFRCIAYARLSPVMLLSCNFFIFYVYSR